MTPTSFLSLPRELRQKIIAETFNANNQISERSTSPTTLIDLAIHCAYFEATRYFDYDCADVLEVAETWTATLRKVHLDIVEDVEYVVGKVDWIEKVKGLIKNGNTLWTGKE